MICIGDENLKSKLKNERYVIKTVIDDDKQEIFKVYDSAPIISIEQANISDKEDENQEKNIEKENEEGEEKNPKNELFCKLKVTGEDSKFVKFDINVKFFIF